MVTGWVVGWGGQKGSNSTILFVPNNFTRKSLLFDRQKSNLQTLKNQFNGVKIILGVVAIFKVLSEEFIVLAIERTGKNKI